MRLTRGLVVACHPGPTAAVTLLMTALAFGVGHSPGRALLIGVAVLVGQLSVGWSNDAVDAKRDLANARMGKPVTAGLVSARTLWVAAWSALASTVALSFIAAGFIGGAAHVVAVLSAWAYNVGIKATPFSPVPYAVSFGLLPLMLTYSLVPPARPAVWVPIVFALLAVGAHLANGLPDIEHDRLAQHRGLVARMGHGPSSWLAQGFLIAGTVVLVVGINWPAWLVVVVVAVQSGILVALGRWRAGFNLFKGVLVLVLVDVALVLAFSGGIAVPL
jgi:4-hydroxybenzoate polyprenyltransferase